MATIETRRSAKGTVYRVKVRLEGQPPVSRSFTRLAAAKAWAADVESRMRNGLFAASSGRTVAEAVDAFLDAELTGKKDQRMLIARCGWWRERLDKVRLRDLAPWHISECLDRLEAEPQAAKKLGGTARSRTAATVNRYRAAISAVLTWAERQTPPWIGTNPARRTKHRPERRGRTRFLSANERGALLAEARRSASADLYLAVVLSLATGARQSEVMGLSWPDVDIDRGTVTFRDTKNGDTRSVPLPADALTQLRERRGVVRLDTDLVFPSRKKVREPADLRAGFRAALRRAGITDFRWHDQRHSAASALADMGASLIDIGSVLGHRSQQTTKRYAHLTESHLRDLIEQAAQKHRVA
jgi:integrase